MQTDELAAADSSTALRAGPKPARAAKRSLPFLAGSLAGGNLAAMALNMAGGVLLARLVAPATLGLFNGVGLILGYVPFLQLGILNGLNRELPFHVGKGDRTRVNELAAAAQAWALVVGGTVCVALLGVAGWQLAHGEFWKTAAWATNAVLALFLFYNTYYLQMTYRTSHDFARLALFSVVTSGAALLLLLLVSWLSFYGLCIRALFVGAIGMALHFHWRPVRVEPKWNNHHLRRLLVVGAPIFGVGQLYVWWGVINSTLVLKLAGTEGMGLYSMVLMAGAALGLLPSAISQVIYPRMAEQYGRNESLDDVLRMAWRPMIMTAGCLIPLIAAAWWLVGPVMQWVVPSYADAAPAVQWALLLPLVASFGAVLNVFNVVRRQDLYVVGILLGMAAYGGSLMWLVRDGVALASFPQAMLIGSVVFTMVSYLFIWYLRSRRVGGQPS